MSNAMDKLLAAVNKANTKKNYDEDKDYFYYPDRDVAGNGNAVIRFLPYDEAEDGAPFVKTYKHSFQNKKTGKWFINECPTTLNIQCPICDENGKLYAAMTKDEARKHGLNRKLSYVSRVLVVSDPKNPDNEGKVFFFRYGKIIYDKIIEKLIPSEADIEEAKVEGKTLEPLNVFSLKEGARFKLKIRKVDDQTNYDKSSFDDPSVCKVKVFEQFTPVNDIQKFLDPKLFKTTEQLQKQFDTVTGKSSLAPQSSSEDEPQSKPKTESTRTRTVLPKDDDGDADDIMKLVKSLSTEDDDIPF